MNKIYKVLLLIYPISRNFSEDLILGLLVKILISLKHCIPLEHDLV